MRLRKKSNKDAVLSSSSPTYKVLQSQAQDFLSHVEDIASKTTKAAFKELIQSPETLEAKLALSRVGSAPIPLNQTSSGTYVVHNREGKPCGIFKPAEQEVGGEKNPSRAMLLRTKSVKKFLLKKKIWIRFLTGLLETVNPGCSLSLSFKSGIDVNSDDVSPFPELL